jgi:hypothetical protein
MQFRVISIDESEQVTICAAGWKRRFCSSIPELQTGGFSSSDP